jgi:hypothetical protein
MKQWVITTHIEIFDRGRTKQLYLIENEWKIEQFVFVSSNLHRFENRANQHLRITLVIQLAGHKKSNWQRSILIRLARNESAGSLILLSALVPPWTVLNKVRGRLMSLYLTVILFIVQTPPFNPICLVLMQLADITSCNRRWPFCHHEQNEKKIANRSSWRDCYSRGEKCRLIPGTGRILMGRIGEGEPHVLPWYTISLSYLLISVT